MKKPKTSTKTVIRNAIAVCNNNGLMVKERNGDLVKLLPERGANLLDQATKPILSSSRNNQERLTETLVEAMFASGTVGYKPLILPRSLIDRLQRSVEQGNFF